MSEQDDDEQHEQMLRRATAAAMRFGFCLAALVGFFAEVALTMGFCGLLGLNEFASAFVHMIVALAYLVAVVVTADALFGGT